MVKPSRTGMVGTKNYVHNRLKNHKTKRGRFKMTEVKFSLEQVKETAEKYDNSTEAITAKLKSVQSVKSRFKKQKGRPDYETKMTEILTEEQLLKEARQYLEPKKVLVTEMTQSDIDKLTYDETVKAIKSIQSKKCLTQFNPDAKSEYEKSLRIEQMLKDHRETVKDHSDNLIKKSKINDLIHHIEQQQTTIDKEYILELLNNLINE